MSIDYTLKTYRKADLQNLIDSEEYRQSDNLPVSYHRALSYIHNPRSDAEDIVLITAMRDGKLIGYRMVMPDWLYNGDRKIKVAWISGTWVHPDYRRKGLATELFYIIYRAWKGRFIFTNYQPVSKKIYDKTALFKTYSIHTGKRFYLRSNIAELVIARSPGFKPFRYFFSALDALANLVFPNLYVRPAEGTSRFSELKRPLSEEEIRGLFSNTLSKRGAYEYNWIVNYPWVIDRGKTNIRKSGTYHFSWMSRPFRQYFSHLENDGTSTALVMITLKGKQMKIPYYNCQSDNLGLLASYLLNEAKKGKVSHMDVFDHELSGAIQRQRRNFIWSKTHERRYMISSEIVEELPSSESVRIPDGEGDVVFV